MPEPPEINQPEIANASDVPAGPNRIMLKVLKWENQSIHYFRMNKNTRLAKLFQSCYSKCGVASNTVRFRYGDVTISDEDTLASLGIQEFDTIDMIPAQEGGSF